MRCIGTPERCSSIRFEMKLRIWPGGLSATFDVFHSATAFVLTPP
jgi:hypothetical protein